MIKAGEHAYLSASERDELCNDERNVEVEDNAPISN